VTDWLKEQRGGALASWAGVLEQIMQNDSPAFRRQYVVRLAKEAEVRLRREAALRELEDSITEGGE
jgi:hypothetical protein